MKVIDNFLCKSYHKNILELMTDPNFEWGYGHTTFPIEKDHSDFTNFNEYGFSHIFFDEERGAVGRFASHIQPLLFQILDVTNCDFILRSRADMVTWSKEDFIHPAHIDFPISNTAAVFYINETDGDTIFYNVKSTAVLKDKELKEYDRVSPKANRLVIFDGDLLHTGCSPTKHKNRILINSNFIKKEYGEEFKVFLKNRTSFPPNSNERIF